MGDRKTGRRCGALRRHKVLGGLAEGREGAPSRKRVCRVTDGKCNGRKHSKDGSMSSRRNLQREKCIDRMETAKKEKVDENVETQNKTRKSKKQTMGENK